MSRLVISPHGVYLDDFKIVNCTQAHLDMDAKTGLTHAQLVLVHGPGEVEVDTGEDAKIRVVYDDPNPRHDEAQPQDLVEILDIGTLIPQSPIPGQVGLRPNPWISER